MRPLNCVTARSRPRTVERDGNAMSQPFRLIAAKGMQNGIFRLWYGAAENDRSPFVLTLTPRYVAHALHKALPVTLEDIEEYAQENEDRLRAIARDARACGQNAKVLE
jgi:hypothetical protein